MDSITSHSELSDHEFEQQFEQCTLVSSLFTHEAHLRLAWIHIEKYGAEQAVKNIPQHLIKYVESLDAKDKYHETITIAAVKAVHHFKLRSKTSSFPEFIAVNGELLTQFKALLSSHYSLDIFNSELAKEEFIQPDLAPLD